MFKRLGIIGWLLITAGTGWGGLILDKTIGGNASAIAVYCDKDGSGKTYAYVAQGAALVMYDVTDPQSPVKVGALFPGSNRIADLALSGTTLVAAAGAGGTYVFSLGNPTTPKWLNTLPISPRKLDLNGSALATTSSYFGGSPSMNGYTFVLMDIHDPENPMSIHDVFHSSRILIMAVSVFFPDIEPQDPGMSDIYFWDRASSFSRLERWRLIFGEGNQATQFVLGRVTKNAFNEHSPLLQSFLGMFAIRPYGFFTYADRFAVMDLFHDPEPVEINAEPVEDIQGPALRDGQSAYIPRPGEWRQYDISNPPNLSFVRTVHAPFQPRLIVNGIGYATIPQQGAVLAPLTEDPREDYTLLPPVIPQADYAARDGNLLAACYTTGGPVENATTIVQLFEVSQEDELNPAGSIQLPGIGIDLLMAGGTLIAAVSGGFHVVDVRNPMMPAYQSTIPKALPHYSAVSNLDYHEAALHKNYLYIYNPLYGNSDIPIRYLWHVYSLQDLQHPVLVKTVELPERMESFVIRNDVLYYFRGFSEEGEMLTGVIDLQNPEDPRVMVEDQQSPTPDPIHASMTVEEDRLIICANRNYYNHITVYDLEDVWRPTKVDTFQLSYYGPDKSPFYAPIDKIYVRKDKLITLESRDWGFVPRRDFQALILFDISNLQNPAEKARIILDAFDKPPAMLKMNHHVLIPARQAGLLLYLDPATLESTVEGWAEMN